LNLKTRRRFSAADFDSARDDSSDVRTILDDAIENLIEPADSPVLSLDPAKFHAVPLTRSQPIR
jgi:hypothetical protein